MPWQKWFLIHALELHPTEVGEDDGALFRFRKVVLLVGRQNGKSTVMQALTLWRMFVDRCNLVIGTAQDLEVAESLWAEVVEMAEEVDELKDEIARVDKGSGKKALRLKSGETYKVKAVSRRGGRGLSGELVLLDELREHQSWDAWGAVTKTTNARERAQIYGISNAGDAASVVLRHLRKTAHARLGDPDGLNADEAPDELLPDDADPDEFDLGDDDSLGIFEWSAAAGCNIGDRDGWAQANPALGHRIREATIASDAANDPEWIFRTEVLCQWSDGTLEGPFPPGTWEAGVDPASQIADEKVRACIDMSHDRARVHIAFSGRRADGVPHVEIVASRAGSDWVRPWLSARRDLIVAVAGQGKGAPASGLLAELAKDAVDGETGQVDPAFPVELWQGSDLTNGTGAFYDAVRGNTFRHLPQPILDVAAAVAVTKPSGDGWLWDRRHSPADIAPLIAATGALWLLNRPTEAPKRSKYEDADLVVV